MCVQRASVVAVFENLSFRFLRYALTDTALWREASNINTMSGKLEGHSHESRALFHLRLSKFNEFGWMYLCQQIEVVQKNKDEGLE
jgi:hypothetical protein